MLGDGTASVVRLAGDLLKEAKVRSPPSPTLSLPTAAAPHPQPAAPLTPTPTLTRRARRELMDDVEQEEAAHDAATRLQAAERGRCDAIPLHHTWRTH